LVMSEFESFCDCSSKTLAFKFELEWFSGFSEFGNFEFGCVNLNFLTLDNL